MSEIVSNNGHHGRYTHGHEQATLASHSERTAANSAAYFADVLEPGMTVLDVGCGPGTITLDLAQLVSPGRVVGIENVEAPLIAARAEAERRGDTVTRFEVADAYALPYDDNSFDVVHAHQVLQHVADPVAVLCEMARICKPGGWIAVRDADYAAMAWHPQPAGMDLWRDLYRQIARGNGGEPDAGRHLREWAQAAGIQDARFTSTVWNYADAEICSWWGQSQASRFGGGQFAEQALAHGAGPEVIEEIARGWRQWGAAPDAWFAILHGELLARKPV